MINYLKSENYRILRKRSLYITVGICFLLMTAAALVLYMSHKFDANFPYATSTFFYSNVIGLGLIIILLGFVFNITLTGKDNLLMKQSVSFGISRKTIFWSKLIVTISYFLLICLIGILLMIGLGEGLLSSEKNTVSQFLIASFNMLPLVVSGFFMIHAFKMTKTDDVYITILLLLVYVFSGTLLRLIPKALGRLSDLYTFAPNTLFHENLASFMVGAAQFDYRFWLVGIVISAISLILGFGRFAKLDID